LGQHRYYVPSLSDKALVTAFKKAYLYLNDLGKIPNNQLKVSITSSISHQPFQVITSASWDSSDVDILSKSGNVLITNISLNFSNFSFSYNRTPPQNETNGSLGIVHVTISGAIVIDLSETEKLNAILSKGLLLGQAGEQNNLIESHSTLLSEMQSLAIKVQEDTSDFRNKLEAEFIDKFKKVEAEKDEKITEIQEVYKRKTEALDARIKELDDRANTHARREIRKEINTKIKNRIDNFKPSKEVNNLRWPLHIAYVLLILSSGYGLFFFSHEFLALLEKDKIATSNVAIVLALIKPLTFTGIFSSGFIFYIKWLNYWFEKNSSEESMLRKYQLDVERSSWIVETVLESVGQHKQELPKELILSFSNNLFQINEDSRPNVEHPIDQLASAILGSASSAKVKVGDTMLELDRKSMKELSKTS